MAKKIEKTEAQINAEKAKKAEAKRAKFVELVGKRMTKAMSAVRNVGSLANLTNYTFDKTDAAKIEKVLTAELDAVTSRYVDALAGKKPTTAAVNFDITA